MQIDVREDSGIVFIEPVGDIDGKTAPELHDAVIELGAAQGPHCPEYGTGRFHVQRRICARCC